MEFTELLVEQVAAARQGKDLTVATIVAAEGGTTRTAGKMLVYADGTISGTIGGGAVERSVIRDALETLKTGKNGVKVYDYDTEMAEKGLSCGGKLTVFLECCRCTRPQLVMVGGGHVGTALLRAAKAAGFTTVLVDTRGEGEIGEAIALADRFLPVPEFRNGVAGLSFRPGAYYVVATYGHTFDGDALGGVLSHTDAAYVGMIGSRRKVSVVFDRLKGEGFSSEALASVHSPIGLDLGGETPEEIAVSILAELLMVKNHCTRKAIFPAK